MHRLSIKVAKSSCCTGHKERTERKSSLSGDQGGAVQLRLAAAHISRSQCHNIAAAALVHRTLTFEPPAPSCLWDLRADHQGPLVPSSTPFCRWGSAGAESCWGTGQAGDNTESQPAGRSATAARPVRGCRCNLGESNHTKVCDNQTARKAEEREDRCSQLIAAVAGPK